VETRELRNAFGRFPTGVAVVVARSAAGSLAGLTVNSVAPVALAPARLLWSLGSASRNRPVFEQAARFAVNVLREDQVELARRMSSPVPDRFAGLAWRPGTCSGLPLFEGCVAAFECRRSSVAEVGDHVVFVGDIEGFDEAGGAPLLYSAGRYARLPQAVA
jgi:flavin reductase (DIM6/NTAB) family NADH-FMN oxidoreductase RutF